MIAARLVTFAFIAMSFVINVTAVMFLWDSVMPSVFGLPKLTWLQTAVILCMVNISAQPLYTGSK